MEKIGPKSEKQATRIRIPIPVDEKLAVALRYQVTGESIESLMYQFHIHGTTISLFIGDDPFPLTTYCMKPYSQRNSADEQIIFIFKALHYRRAFEKGFGILAGRFRLFLSRCHLFPENPKLAVLAAVAVHNILREKSADAYMQAGYVDFEV